MGKLFFLCLLSLQLFAHQTGLSYIEIEEDASHLLHVLYKKPLSDKKGKDISINYPQQCTKTSQAPQSIENGFIINSYTLWCGKRGLWGERIWVGGLKRKDRGVLIRYEYEGALIKSLLRSRTPYIHLTKERSEYQLFLEYVNLGLFHIWSGFDHLLFVLSLLLLASNFKKVLYAITAFTLAHSITLAFGILGIVSVGVKFVEAMIALSILFLARELLRKQDSFSKRHIGIVAFIFGLLHGFGFSSALRDIGLPQNEIPLSLFAFNVGIEIGQVVFILLSTLILFVLHKLLASHFHKVQTTLVYFIGAISSYWLIERVLSF